MKKVFFLLGLAMIIALGGCKKDEPKKGTLTCNITSPQDGATISNAATVVVSVEVKSYNEVGVIVTLYVDDVICNAVATAPYDFTIPSELLPIGSHTIRAMAVDENAVQATSSITITIYEDENESPNFVTFADGQIPASWITSSWTVDIATGYDDHYSLKSSGDAAAVLTQKTYTAYGYIEFYTKGEYFNFYLNGNKPDPLSSSPAGEWTRWVYDFPAGTYTFRWETLYANTIHLDAITFSTSELPKVTTNATVTDITAISATSGGNVTNNGNSPITARGICWSTSENPTIEDEKTVDGSGTGSFTSEMTELTSNTLYYVRAYATNAVGTAYGEPVTFTTQTASLPKVTTLNVTKILSSSAECGGNVTDDGNSPVTARGVCWSTSENPTIDDKKTVNGSGTGSFTSEITGLTPNTAYYVRAYATNSKGTDYGEQRSFTPKFSIGEEYQGGIIAYIDNTGMHGFIASSYDEWYVDPIYHNYHDEMRWDAPPTTVIGASGTAIGTGKSNTTKIVQSYPDSRYAANMCRARGNAWYLPSKDELNELYKNRNAIGGFETTFNKSSYWSSSEISKDNAWGHDFYSGKPEENQKPWYLRCRCLRDF